MDLFTQLIQTPRIHQIPQPIERKDKQSVSSRLHGGNFFAQVEDGIQSPKQCWLLSVQELLTLMNNSSELTYSMYEDTHTHTQFQQLFQASHSRCSELR